MNFCVDKGGQNICLNMIYVYEARRESFAVVFLPDLSLLNVIFYLINLKKLCIFGNAIVNILKWEFL